MNEFRILNVSYESDIDQLDRNEDRGRFNLEISNLEAARPGNGNLTSVVLGRNGQGKSRLLGGIAALFSHASIGEIKRSKRNYDFTSMPPGLEVNYISNGQTCTIKLLEGNKILTQADGSNLLKTDANLPSQVVSLCTGVVDKFPLNSSSFNSESVPSILNYHYIGLRDRSGRSSSAGALLRAVEILVRSVSQGNENWHNVAHVFNLLGYYPKMRLQLSWRSAKLRDNSNLLDEIVEDSYSDSSQISVIGRRIRRVGRDGLPKVKSAIKYVSKISYSRGFELDLVFDGASIKDLSLWRHVDILLESGLIEVAGAEIQSIKTSRTIDLREMSSGEQALVISMLGVAGTIKDGSLIIIDEPETGLHPEWQAQYTKLLHEMFGKYSGCHFLVATHSPLIVSTALPSFSNVISFDQNIYSTQGADALFGNSVDEVLLRAFNVVGDNNLYLKELIIAALRLAADGKVKTERFSQLVEILNSITPLLDESGATRFLIDDLNSIIESE